MKKQVMLFSAFWKWGLIAILLLPLGGCSYVTYAYIQIFLVNKTDALSEFSSLNNQITNWPELEFQSDCAERSHFMRKFRSIKNDSIRISNMVNTENGTLALAFSQVGVTAFTPDAENMFIELTGHLKKTFGEERIVVRRDKNSGKEALENSLKGDTHKLFFCEQQT